MENIKLDSSAEIVSIAAGSFHTVALKKDGTLLAVGLDMEGECDLEGSNDFKDIKGIAAGKGTTAVIKKDGTATAYGPNLKGECNVTKENGFSNLAAVSASSKFTLGLKKDGSIVATRMLFDLEWTSALKGNLPSLGANDALQKPSPTPTPTPTPTSTPTPTPTSTPTEIPLIIATDALPNNKKPIEPAAVGETTNKHKNLVRHKA